jgi:hypothetical protein
VGALDSILAVDDIPPAVILLSESGTPIEEVLGTLCKVHAKKPRKSPLAGGSANAVATTELRPFDVFSYWLLLHSRQAHMDSEHDGSEEYGGRRAV